jgi:pimeloyl-ACP methyl ester carboxylesterase
MDEIQRLEYDGHWLAYQVSGQGPALVVLNLYRRREDLVRLRLIQSGWQVFQIAPLGYGYSERVPGYAGEALTGQILAVLDRHSVDHFVVWGYSAGAAMAACIARGTWRTAGLVCGGFSFLGSPSAASMRQMDLRLRRDHPSRTLWPWVKQIDWAEELKAMPFPRLLYWGSEDRQMAKRLRFARDLFSGHGVEFLEFPGLDHGAFSQQVRVDLVIPAIEDWIARTVGPSW